MNDEQRKAIHAKKNGGSGVSKKDFDEELNQIPKTKEISLDQFRNLSDDFYKKLSRRTSYDGKSYFIANAPSEFILDGLSLKYAKSDYAEAVRDIKDAQEWIIQREAEGLGYDEEGMRKKINNSRTAKSRAKSKIAQLNKEFEKELAWITIYTELKNKPRDKKELRGND
tara:strand:- start:553 stop:1059 length:507 start_codon:yes stop_codon:yes gene_type:complete